MRTCGACGQLLQATKWRNSGPPPQRQHVAGEVVVYRAGSYSSGFPWGRVVDRVQSCTRCDQVLIHGAWAVFFEPGAAVLEHGEVAPILVELAHSSNLERVVPFCN